MDLEARLNSIPRGDTCKGVNRLVIEKLLERFDSKPLGSLFDVPCGRGEFLDAVKSFFPEAATAGGDLLEPAGEFGHRFVEFDAEDPPAMGDERFDAITCISGVMMFDNTLRFLKRLREKLSDDGVLIVTNDNVLSIRDRLLFLFGGRFSQFPFKTTRGGAVWKIIPPQNLIQLLDDAGFSLKEYEYVPVVGANWIWALVGAPIFVLQYLADLFGGSPAVKREIFSLRSFLSRHYVIVCHPTPTRER